MPNLVNEILLEDLKSDFESMGSCVVVQFDKLQPKQDLEIRARMRETGVKYRVVRNRLAQRAFKSVNIDMDPALAGKCAIAIAENEEAITAAKALKEISIKLKKASPITIMGGVIEGTTYTGAAAAEIAELPDRHTVNTMIATAISGPARSIATILNAVGGGMARCIEARIDKGEGGEDS